MMCSWFRGRLGDGTLLGNAMNVEEVRAACAVIFGARDGDPHPVTVTLIAASGTDGQERIDREVPKWGKPGGRDFAVAGDAATIACAVRDMGAAGITSVVIQATEDEPDLVGFVEFLGREVRPLL